jgi:photosystem II stability/assembly factor-like uncharacterized protein
MTLSHLFFSKGRVAALLILVELTLACPGRTQWRVLLHIDTAQFSSVYFLNQFGKPEIGFVGGFFEHWPATGTAVHRTSNKGETWNEIDVIPGTEGAWLVDFSFKDSLTGWFAMKGGPTSPLSGVYKTTDGGMTWGSAPVLQGEFSGVTYNRWNGGLFVTGFGSLTHDSLNFVSWDEGVTWTELAPRSNRDQGKFAFIDSLHGIHTGFDDEIPKPGTYWYLTSDAGHTWERLNIDSTSWEPVPILGTSTWFAITRYGCVLRTDDNWRTWSTIYRFPQQTDHVPMFRDHPCSSWMGGDGGILFVQFTSGAYASCDSGLSWVSLNGPSSLSIEFNRPYWDGRCLYVPTKDSAKWYSIAALLRLDLGNQVHAKWSDNTTEKHFRVSEAAIVMCTLSNDWTDSVVEHVTFDPDVFEWQRAVLPEGWLYRASPGYGTVDVTIVRPPGSVHDTTFLLNFGTTLSKPQSSIVVQPLAVYVDSLDLPCLAQAPQRSDTLLAYFDGCGNDLLWHFMQTGSVFELLRIEPNPASQSVTVVLERRDAGQVAISVSDVLGNERLSATTSQARETLDVSKLPSGIYFLRASEAGTVRTRRFVINR